MAGNRKTKIGFRVNALLFLLSVLLCSWTPWPQEPHPVRQIQDDSLAEKYCPIFIQSETIKPDITHIYYRMSEDDSRILIAYHPVWPYEKDEREKGIQALFNKIFYTGGFKLQKKIFGPEDIEAIEIVVDKQTGQILRLRYESAGHQQQEKSQAQLGNSEKLYLEVTTWNHMFELINQAQAQGKKIYNIKPEYFSEELWNYYQMTKKRQGPFAKDRAHFEWEHQ